MGRLGRQCGLCYVVATGDGLMRSLSGSRPNRSPLCVKPLPGIAATLALSGLVAQE